MHINKKMFLNIPHTMHFSVQMPTVTRRWAAEVMLVDSNVHNGNTIWIRVRVLGSSRAEVALARLTERTAQSLGLGWASGRGSQRLWGGPRDWLWVRRWAQCRVSGERR